MQSEPEIESLEKTQHFAQEERYIREESIRLQRNLQLEVEHREQIHRLLPTQAGQSMIPQQINVQNQVRKPFRPWQTSPPSKVQPSNPQPPQTQQITERQTDVKLFTQAHALAQQQALLINEPRLAQQVNNILRVQPQPARSNVHVPQFNQQDQQPHNIRMVQQIVTKAQRPKQQQQHQAASNQINEKQQKRTEKEIQAPSTSNLTPKTDGKSDFSGSSMKENRKRKSSAINQSSIRNETPLQNIRPPTVPLPPPFQQYALHQQLKVVKKDYVIAKLLLMIDSGEERLITFTLPDKETCTVQAFLDQIGVKVEADCNIECIETPNSEIDYIVKIGNFASHDTEAVIAAALEKLASYHIRQQEKCKQENRKPRNKRNTEFQT